MKYINMSIVYWFYNFLIISEIKVALIKSPDAHFCLRKNFPTTFWISFIIWHPDL